MVYPYRQLSLYCTFHKHLMTFNRTGDVIYVYQLSRFFPKVDHSGINARIVLEQIYSETKYIRIIKVSVIQAMGSSIGVRHERQEQTVLGLRVQVLLEEGFFC